MRCGAAELGRRLLDDPVDDGPCGEDRFVEALDFRPAPLGRRTEAGFPSDHPRQLDADLRPQQIGEPQEACQIRAGRSVEVRLQRAPVDPRCVGHRADCQLRFAPIIRRSLWLRRSATARASISSIFSGARNSGCALEMPGTGSSSRPPVVQGRTGGRAGFAGVVLDAVIVEDLADYSVDTDELPAKVDQVDGLRRHGVRPRQPALHHVELGPDFRPSSASSRLYLTRLGHAVPCA